MSPLQWAVGSLKVIVPRLPIIGQVILVRRTYDNDHVLVQVEQLVGCVCLSVCVLDDF